MKQHKLTKGVSIRVLLRYIATAVFIAVATPQLNKVEPTLTPPQTAHQSVQLVAEIPAPSLVQQATVTTVPQPVPTPKQGCEAYRAEVAKYDWNITIAMAIMKAESGCRSNAVGDNYPIRGLHAPSCGLMQIRSLQGRPSCEQLKDPATNIAWAYKLYLGSGWYPWSVFKNGAYRNYM